MRKFGSVAITVVASIVVVPVVFALLALANWNLFVPLVRAVSTSGADWLEVFVWHMLAPFRQSIKSIRYMFHHIDDAMKGEDTLNIVEW